MRKTSASWLASRSGGKPWLGVMAAIRWEPRSGQMTPEPTSRKCGTTRMRSICSSLGLASANTAQLRWSLAMARTSMRRTIPSGPGAVDTCSRSSTSRYMSTSGRRLITDASRDTGTASRAWAGTTANAMTMRANRRATISSSRNTHISPVRRGPKRARSFGNRSGIPHGVADVRDAGRTWGRRPGTDRTRRRASLPQPNADGSGWRPLRPGACPGDRKWPQIQCLERPFSVRSERSDRLRCARSLRRV